MDWQDIAEYESLRLLQPIHKLRFSMHAGMVQSGPGQTIMLSKSEACDYTCFRLVEAGIQIPIGNVASAIPKGAALGMKLRKTTGSRLTEKPQQQKRVPKDVPRKQAPRGEVADVAQ